MASIHLGFDLIVSEVEHLQEAADCLLILYFVVALEAFHTFSVPWILPASPFVPGSIPNNCKLVSKLSLILVRLCM